MAPRATGDHIAASAEEIAFAAAAERLRLIGIPGNLAALEEVGLRLSRSVLGGSHSVAIYPPIDSFVPIDACFVPTLDYGEATSLYIHIAFCETRCTFCHYAVDHYATAGPSHQAAEQAATRYVDALRNELRRWAARLAASGTEVSSIYIGGGTPLVLPAPQLQQIIDTVFDEFSVRPGSEFCVEGSPLTITAEDGREKLELLRSSGVNRLSFGVQSFDDNVLKYAARGYTRELPARAADITASVFDNWNIDLIQGLYKGSPYEVWNNLAAIAQIKPPHLTWYHARFAARPQRDWFNTAGKSDDFESDFEILLGRMLLWNELEKLGYQQTDGNRFVLATEHVDPFKPIRTSPSSSLIGVGASAYSHVRAQSSAGVLGYAFRNDPNIGSYVAATLAGGEPIKSGRALGARELLATSYATGLRGGRMETEELRAIARTYPDLQSHYASIIEPLKQLAVLEDDPNPAGQTTLRLSDLGRLFEDEVLSLFFSPAVLDSLRAGTRWQTPPRSIAPPTRASGPRALERAAAL